MREDSSGEVNSPTGSNVVSGLGSLRCKNVELTTLDIALLGRKPKHCEILFFPKLILIPVLLIALWKNFCFRHPICAYF